MGAAVMQPGIGRLWRGVASRRIWWLLLVAALPIVVWGSGALGTDVDASWAPAHVQDLVVGVDVEGTLASRDSSMLGPPLVPGMFDFKIRFMAPEGSEVAEGTPVLGFDTSDLGRRLLQLQTEAEEAGKNIEKLDADQQQRRMQLDLQLAEAEASLRKAKLKADVPDDLRSAHEAKIAALDVELARHEVESLRGQIEALDRSGRARRASLVAQKERAERLVRETQQAIASMTVAAPRSGTVIYVTNWRGDKKKVGDSTWRFERVIELPDLTQMMAQGEVDEADAGRIAEGQAVSLRLDAHPDIEYTGRIESIWRTVQRKRRSRNPIKVVRLDIALDQTDTERMRPGMRFRGRIEIDRIRDALVVPVSAVFPTAAGPVVYREAMLGVRETPVVLGPRNGEFVQVLQGLRPGTRVARTRPQP